MIKIEMRHMPKFVFIAILVMRAVPCLSAQEASDAECSQISPMSVYSNAWIDQETTDLNGFELALKQMGESKIAALLYVYEGTLADGIPLPGHISGRSLIIEGTWVEHLVEYPSKTETVQTHLVKIAGAMDSKSFRGRITIKDLSFDEDVMLERVRNVWRCKSYVSTIIKPRRLKEFF